MTDFEKIAHLIRFGLPFHKVLRESIIKWADNKINEKDNDDIFLELSIANNSNKIIELYIKHANKYFNSDKLLIKESKLLFKFNNTGSFDTITSMSIKFNKIKL